MKTILNYSLFLIIFFFEISIYPETSKQILIQKTQSGEDEAVISGDLYFFGRDELKLPDIFSYVADNSYAYQFVQRQSSSGKEGYFKIEAVNIQQSSVDINETQLKNEFYKSNVRLKNTPDEWLFGVCSEGAFFFSARGLVRIMAKHKPVVLKRNTMDRNARIE